MPVTNPEAIAFCDQKIRPAADALAHAYYVCKVVLAEWTANNYGGVAQPLEATAGTVQDTAFGTDGTDGDGRKIITANDVALIVARMTALVSDYEANTNTNLNSILGVAVNPVP